jgi:hypothetical protein
MSPLFCAVGEMIAPLSGKMNTPLPRHSWSAAELEQQLRAERRAVPFVGLLTFPWVGERPIQRGSDGQSPASDSIARAISAPGLWKP